MHLTRYKTISSRIVQVVPFLLIAAGILLRLVIFVQNRNLIIDEANIVRNLDERGFIALLRPLSYEQFAPPVFLWFEKLCSICFGYGEKAVRLYPLLCGIASLFVMERILHRLLPGNSRWLPIGLMCFAPILVKYSAEVKQYVPDSLVALLLVWLALSNDLFAGSRKRFILLWIVAGSVAIWASQPSVFILASVGAYYFFQSAQKKDWRMLQPLLLIGAVWLCQFALYFKVILEAQINSAYLQNYHHDYFLNIWPRNLQEWQHNWMRIKEILSNTGGWNNYARIANAILLLSGCAYLLYRHTARFLLIVLPVLLTLLAAALHQFSLIDRVAIFLLPFCMITIGYGMALLMKIRFFVVPLGLTLLGAWELKTYNFFPLFSQPFEFHELTRGFDYILQKGGTGKELYVDCASGPTYDYYTRLHPDRQRWSRLLGAHVFGWADDNFPEIAAQITTPKAYFIFTGGGPDARNHHVDQVKEYLQQTDYYEYAICYVFTFAQKAIR